MTTNQACCNLVLDETKADYHFVYYYLCTQYNQLRGLASGVRKNLSSAEVKEFPIRLPGDVQSQRKISHILVLLDDKIELNQRINAELEAMAKLLYDYWFVQFDFPFDFAQGKPSKELAARMRDPGSKAGMTLEGKPYKSSGGPMVYNAELKREVPVGWGVDTLLKIADYENGLACQRFRPTGDEHLRVIKIREMHDGGFSADAEKVRPDIPAKAIIENGDVLFAWSASLEVMLWTGGKGALNQHIFKVSSAEYPRSFYYHQLLNYLQHFKMMAENRKTTMGHITLEHLRQSRIVIPPMDLVRALDAQLKPIHDLMVTNAVQNHELSTLRDWLLPMLMNGQVTVGAAEEELGLAMAAEGAGKYGKRSIK